MTGVAAQTDPRFTLKLRDKTANYRLENVKLLSAVTSISAAAGPGPVTELTRRLSMVAAHAASFICTTFVIHSN